MRKKILAVVAATVITTLAFTGCGKSNESKSSSDKGVTGAFSFSKVKNVVLQGGSQNVKQGAYDESEITVEKN